MLALRIFVSSPGDVGSERAIAVDVIERLQAEFGARVTIDTYLWERTLMRAHDTFQAQILDIQEADLAIFILWSRMGTMLPGDQFRRPDGSPYMSGTEFEFERALEGFQARGKPDMVFYLKNAEMRLSIRDRGMQSQQTSQLDSVNRFVDRAFRNPDGTYKSAFYEFEKTARFEELLEVHLRDWLRSRLQSETAQPGVRAWKDAPFRGLEPFQFEHALIYCGRTGLVADVLDALRRRADAGYGFLMVLGMSGAGKSSLVRAGLMPMLARPRVIEDVLVWRRAVFRPSTSRADTWIGLAGALLDKDALPDLAADAAALAALLQRPHALIPALTRALDAMAKAAKDRLHDPDAHGGARLILLVDQLEELFDEGTTAAERDAFALTLSALARSGQVWVIATMRADYYGRCAEFPEEFRDLYIERGGIYTLGGPRPAEIAQIIRQPVAMAGLTFERRGNPEESLDDVLRDAAIHQPSVLPLLEFTLDELWKRGGQSGMLRFADYEDLGGLNGALRQRANEEFERLPAAAKAALPRVLGALVRTDASDDRLIVQGQVSSAEFMDLPDARALIDAFVKARLLVADHGADGTPVIGLAHEALLRHWPPAVEWIEQNRESLRLRAGIAAAAALWRADDGRDERLLSGALLKDAARLAASDQSPLTAEERRYIALSVAHASRARRRNLRRVALATAAVIVAILIPAIGVGQLTYYATVAGNVPKVWTASDRLPLSDLARANLDASVDSLTEHLAKQAALFGKDPAERAWGAAERWMALLGSRSQPSGELFAKLAAKERSDPCFCWRETDDKLPHTMATAWVIYAMGHYKQAATHEEIAAILKTQRPDGWWSMYPATDDALNASTAATAWMLLALHAQAANGLIAADQRTAVAAAIKKGVAFLVARVDPGTARWPAYPPSQAAETTSFTAISALVIHTLQVTAAIHDYDALWLEGLPRDVPGPVDSETAKGQVYESGHKFTLDDSRHYQFPWMLRATVDTYARGSTLQRARAAVWIDRLLRRPLRPDDFHNQDWTMAEALIALRYAQDRLAKAKEPVTAVAN